MWPIYESVEDLGIKPYIQSNCTCGIIAQKFNPVVELVIPVEKLTKEAIA